MKAVRFNHQASVMNANRLAHDDESLSEIHMQESDFSRIRKSLADEAAEYKKLGYDALVENTLLIPHAKAQEFLDAHAQLPGTRGLEFVLSRRLSKDRSMCKSIVRGAVLALQQDLQQNGMTLEEISKQLASVSIEKSFCFKTFALRLALADERAANEDLHPDAQELKDILEEAKLKRSTNMLGDTSVVTGRVALKRYHSTRLHGRTNQSEKTQQKRSVYLAPSA